MVTTYYGGHVMLIARIAQRAAGAVVSSVICYYGMSVFLGRDSISDVSIVRSTPSLSLRSVPEAISGVPALGTISIEVTQYTQVSIFLDVLLRGYRPPHRPRLQYQAIYRSFHLPLRRQSCGLWVRASRYGQYD